MKEALQGVVSVAEILAYISQDRCLSLSEACEYLSLSERTVRKLLPDIPHFRVGRKLLLKKSELYAWLERYRESSKDLTLDAMAKAAANDVVGPRKISSYEVSHAKHGRISSYDQ